MGLKIKITIFLLATLIAFGMGEAYRAADYYVRAEAATYYIAQSATGLANGISCANAYAYDWNWSGITGDDTIYICGTISSAVRLNANGTSGHPVTLKFCKDGEADCGTGNTGRFSAAVPPVFGFIGGTSSQFIIIDGNGTGIIEATDNGSSKGNKISSFMTGGIYCASCRDIEIKNLTIQNIYVHDFQVSTSDSISGVNTSGIMLPESYNVKVHNSNISNAGIGVFIRNISGMTLSNNQIYGNTISHSCWGIDLGSGITDSYVDNAQIYNNDIEMGANWSSAGGADCHLNGVYSHSASSGNSWGTTNLQFYNNYLHGPLTDPGGVWVSTAMIASDGYGIETGTKIYNNLVVLGPYADHANHGATNGMVGTGGGLILNNTIIGDSQTSYGTGGSGSLTIQNNIITNCSVGTYVNTSGLDLNTDNNLFYNNASVGATNNGSNMTGSYSTLANWRTHLGGCPAAGHDCNSLASNPDLSATYTLNNESPAIGAGANLTNVGIASLDSDKAGVTRPQGSAWDIGAYEYTSGVDTVSPANPTGLSVR